MGRQDLADQIYFADVRSCFVSEPAQVHTAGDIAGIRQDIVGDAVVEARHEAWIKNIFKYRTTGLGAVDTELNRIEGLVV